MFLSIHNDDTNLSASIVAVSELVIKVCKPEGYAELVWFIRTRISSSTLPSPVKILMICFAVVDC